MTKQHLLTVAPVTVRRRVSIESRLAAVTPAEVAAIDRGAALELWHSLGGGLSMRDLLTPPEGNTKAAKSAAPEYLLALLPHRLTPDFATNCRWSTAACRKTCHVGTGHGARSSVHRGRLARALFAGHYPAHFLALLAHNMRAAVNRDAAAWFRPNSLSDIRWETVLAMRELIDELDDGRRLPRFADYTKANPQQRPQPADLRYRLVRSAFVGRETAADIRELIDAGESVAAVAHDTAAALTVLSAAGVRAVDADETDEWIRRPEPTIGLLAPKRHHRHGRPAGYTAEQLAEAFA